MTDNIGLITASAGAFVSLLNAAVVIKNIITIRNKDKHINSVEIRLSKSNNKQQKLISEQIIKDENIVKLNLDLIRLDKDEKRDFKFGNVCYKNKSNVPYHLTEDWDEGSRQDLMDNYETFTDKRFNDYHHLIIGDSVIGYELEF